MTKDKPTAAVEPKADAQAVPVVAPGEAVAPDPVYHLKQYGDVSAAEMDYYIKHKTLDGFAHEAVAPVQAQSASGEPPAVQPKEKL